MSSVVVTGASRGLGYAFIKHFASQPNTTVIGIARNKEATDLRLKNDGIHNVTILEADITDYKAVQAAADATAKITAGAGGGLDMLVNNAAVLSGVSQWKSMVELEPEVLEEDLMGSFRGNVVGVAHTTNAFLPLIRKGEGKKVIMLGTGLADDALTNKYSIPNCTSYTISKAAMNTLVAKYNAALGKSEGILFLSISPGMVDTSEGKEPSEEDVRGFQVFVAKFSEYAPHWKGPITAKESVEMMMEVIDKASVETMGGDFVSHFGTKEWL